MNGDASTPWGRRWIESLERLATAWQSRLPRGRDYADKGHVVSLSVTPGRIAARVQGSRSKPYTTIIECQPFSDTAWVRVVRRLTTQARWPAELLVGHMPADIDALFQQEHLHLFPIRNSEMVSSCTCPDKAKPCKHIAAVHYAFGTALDRDPFLLFQLRGLDRNGLIRNFREAWFGADADLQGTLRGDSSLDQGIPVQPLSADRFNRSPAAIDQMSFSLPEPCQSHLILDRLGAPSSWQFPLSIHALLGPVYDEAARLALGIALSEPLREGRRTGEEGEELDEDDELLDLDGEFDGDFDDEFDDEEDDDEEDDDEFDDDESDRRSPPASPPQEYRALTAQRDVIDGSSYGAFAPAAPPVLNMTPAQPMPAFRLPRSLDELTQTPVYQRPPDQDEEDRTSVLIRKGVATVGRRRTRNRTTGSLRSSTEGVPVLPAPETATPLPGLPGSVVAVPAPGAAEPAGPTLRRRRNVEAEPELAVDAVAPPLPPASPPPAPDPAPSLPPALPPDGDSAVVRRRMVDMGGPARGRRQQRPAADEVPPSLPEAPMTPAVPMQALRLPSTPLPAFSSSTATPGRPMPALGTPALALSAVQAPGDAATRRARLAVADGDVPTLSAQDWATVRKDALARRARGDADGALAGFRRLWKLRPQTDHLLWMLSAAEDADCLRETVEAEVPAVQAHAIRHDRLPVPELFLLMTGGRFEILADLFDRWGEDAWMAPGDPASLVLPLALMLAVGAEHESLSPQTSLVRLWDELFAQGEELFSDEDEPPAPLGVWLQWTLEEYPAPPELRRRWLQLVREMVEQRLTHRGMVVTEAASVQAAQQLAGLMEALTLMRRREEGRVLLATLRPHIAPRKRLARALEECLEDSPILND
jgi:uncharacterized Zn finger protein